MPSSAGVTDSDVQIDLYSDWKEWVQLSDNTADEQYGQPRDAGLIKKTMGTIIMTLPRREREQSKTTSTIDK